MNPLFRYTCFTISLYILNLHNQDESPAADAIRDEMDPLWDAMTPDEQLLSCRLAEALLLANDRLAGHADKPGQGECETAKNSGRDM